MNWNETGYSYDVTVHVVHQTDVNNVLGSLKGIQLDGMSITEKYYSDSRVQAKVVTMVHEDESDGYVKNARLRIILIVDAKSYSRALVTGYVSDIDETTEHGYTKRTYTLEGTIWGVLNHPMKERFTVKKGQKLIYIWNRLMKEQTRMQYSSEGAADHTFGGTTTYDPGTMLSTILFEISSGYDRMDVNGKGVVTLKKYVEPSKQTPSRVIDSNNTVGLVILPLTKTSAEYESPGRAVVTATITEEKKEKDPKTKEEKTVSVQKLVYGSYDAPSSHPTSMAVRGWISGRTDSYQGTEEKPNKSVLDAEAKKNWQNAQDKGIEWTVKSVFDEYHAGQVATLFPPLRTGSSSVKGIKVLVSTVTTNLNNLTQDLTLKEV